MTAQPINILLIEDEKDREALIRRAFSSDSKPSFLREAFSLREATEMIDRSEPDLIISDLFLTDGRGTDLLGKRMEPPRFPLIVMTGYGDEQMAVDAMKAGVMDYVVKSPESLAVMPVIAGRALRQWQHIRDRHHAETALRESEDRYRAIVEGFDGFIYVCSNDYRIRFMNDKFISRTGYDGTGQLCYKVLHNLEAVCPWCVNEQVFAGKTIRWEALSPLDDRWYFIVNTPIYHQDGTVSKQALILDITERKQVEAELKKHRDHLDELVGERTRELTRTNERLQREIQDRKRMENALKASEYKYKTLFENLPQKIFYKNTDSVYVSCNRHFAEDLGIDPEKIFGKTDFDFFPEDLAGKYRADDNRILLSGRLEEIEETYVEKGRERIVQTVKTPIRNEQGNVVGIQGIFWDITKRKKAEEQNAGYQELLRTLSSELLLTEERERRRIATDLHDRIGQALALSKIKLGILREKVASPDAVREVDEIRDYIEQTINDTRSLTFEISPPVLYEFGLGAALEWLVDQVREHHGILMHFMDDGLPKPLTDGSSILLFRATRELLLNIIKHARAKNVTVSLSRNNGKLRIIVEDDGIGFNASEIRFRSDKTYGYGLFSIQERLSHLGGYLSIASESGKGTRVRVEAPLESLQTEPFGGTGERSNTIGR